MNELLRSLLSQISDEAWLQALIVIVVFALVAQITVWVLGAWIGRLASRTATQVDDQILRRLRKPLFLTVSFFGLYIAAEIALVEDQASLAVSLGRVLRTIVLFSWAGFGMSSFGLLLSAVGRNRHTAAWIEPRTIPLFDNLSKLVIVGVAGYALCIVWDVNATAWLTSAGILGIALGFAAKDTLGNLFSGIFILADAPYQLGDFIVLDSGERGRVTNIGLRSTRLLTRDDIEIVIPNGVIASAKIVNETGGPHAKERVRISVGVSYSSDVDQVVAVLEHIGSTHEGICDDPAPRARFRAFGNSSLDFQLLCWIEEPVLRGQRVHELNMDIFKRFAAEGIEIPFPQRDIHIRSGNLDSSDGA